MTQPQLDREELEMTAASAGFLIPVADRLSGNWDKQSVLAFLVQVQITAEKMLERSSGRIQ